MRKVLRGRLRHWCLLCVPLAVVLLTGAARAALPAGPPPRALERELLTTQRPLTMAAQVPRPPQAPPVAPAEALPPKSLPKTAPEHTSVPPVPSAPLPSPAEEAPSWSKTEKWALSELAAKRAVDLSKAPGEPWLSGAFVAAVIDGSAHVASAIASVRLSNGEVRGDVTLDVWPTASLVAFERVHFTAGFAAMEAHFPGSLKLTYSSVDGPMVLDGARTGASLELQDSTFAQPVSLSGVAVEGAIYLDRSSFLRGLELKNANVVGTIQAYSTSFGCAASCRDSLSLSLSEARIGRDLVLSGVLVQGTTRADYLGIDGNLQIERPTFAESADFTSGTVGKYLVLELPTLPKGLRISQLRYGSISNGQKQYDAADTWRDLQRLLASCEYSSDIYAHLEEFFQDSGEASIADDVYVERKIQERKKLKPAPWLLNWLTYLTIGYGRHPSRAFYWMAVFVALGMLVFRSEKHMDATEPNKPAPGYSAFWYSLDLFVPIARLQAADRWAPKQQRYVAWMYLRLHVLLGWVLVPLGLAAVSGLIQ